MTVATNNVPPFAQVIAAKLVRVTRGSRVPSDHKPENVPANRLNFSDVVRFMLSEGVPFGPMTTALRKIQIDGQGLNEMSFCQGLKDFFTIDFDPTQSFDDVVRLLSVPVNFIEKLLSKGSDPVENEVRAAIQNFFSAKHCEETINQKALTEFVDILHKLSDRHAVAIMTQLNAIIGESVAVRNGGDIKPYSQNQRLALAVLARANNGISLTKDEWKRFIQSFSPTETAIILAPCGPHTLLTEALAAQINEALTTRGVDESDFSFLFNPTSQELRPLSFDDRIEAANCVLEAAGLDRTNIHASIEDRLTARVVLRGLHDRFVEAFPVQQEVSAAPVLA